MARAPLIEPVFVDTNVLIYAHDADAGPKRAIAAERLRLLWQDRNGALSTQVLQEFYTNVTRKIAHPLPRPQARQVVATYSAWCAPVTPVEIEAAFAIEDSAYIGFWDALILASAASVGATILLSEDLNAKQIVAGIRIENPFA